jgi:hypothetical protein
MASWKRNPLKWIASFIELTLPKPSRHDKNIDKNMDFWDREGKAMLS